eukprot:9489952-Pyramimonas_sp.AAC.2
MRGSTRNPRGLRGPGTSPPSEIGLEPGTLFVFFVLVPRPPPFRCQALRFLPTGMDLDQMVDDERKNINSAKSLVVDLKETVALVTWSRPPEPQRSCQTDTSDHVCNFRQDVLDKMGAVKGKFEALMSKAPQRLLIMHKDEINFVRGALSEATALVIEKSHKRYSNMLDMIMFLCTRRSLDDALQVAQRLETVVKEPFELAFKTFMDADSIVLMETFRKELHSV